MRGMAEKSFAVVAAMVTILSVVMEVADAHQLQWGTCRPEASPLQDFNPKRFNGTWWVIKKMVTSSTCMSINFALMENGFLVREMRTPFLFSKTPLSGTVSNEGFFTFDSNNPATMERKWFSDPTNKIVSTSYTIVDTDYDTYAIDVECQSWWVVRRVSATILARNKTLPGPLIQELENKLVNDFGIEVQRMNTIDQTDCLSPEEVDYNVVIDENGPSVSSLLQDDVIETLETEQAVRDYLGLSDPRQE